VVRVEDIGPVIADQVHEWLQHANVTANKGTTDRQLHREPEPTGSR